MKYNTINECVGDYFKRRRIAAKYSMQFVADRLGVQKSSYYYYEIGKNSLPEEYIKKLLDLYNEDGNELLDVINTTFQRYLTNLYAYIHGYKITAEHTKEK